ncbi:MAG: urea carboxylase-associated family protein [Alphaproteobacteria bacterium]|nr:urea carboxylase-associated family protein [Alphaproteobacteria bacterium]
MSASRQMTLPAARGLAVELAAGESLRITNTHGQQVVDTWAFAADDVSEYLSMAITRRMLLKIMPKAGDQLFTNRREPLLTLTEDTSPGIHDILIACCDMHTYEKLGCPDYHRNCADNLVEGLAAIGREPPRIPDPLNLFMNIPVSNNLEIAFEAPVSRPGDQVTLRAERPAIVALSACPMDLMPINGPDQTPRDVALEILG